MRRVLIISPHFPPVNAADMQRVRQSLPYFKKYGWDVEVIAVDPAYIEVYSKDDLLLKTIPADIPVHYVSAWDVNKTRKFGLGSLSIRSFFSIKKKGNELLNTKKFDLVYFSTTAFHVMALGPYWKKKYKLPFILDIQDPWRNDFYLDKPTAERPPKFLLSYNIDKYLEARTVPMADGIISVSQSYCDTFLKRYPQVNKDRCKVITFGAAVDDFTIMRKYITAVPSIIFNNDKVNIVYIGRGGHDMQFALEIIFKAFAKGLQQYPSEMSNVHFWFIGTSYAVAGLGKQTIKPLADMFGVGGHVTEITDRVSYFETLFLLDKADVLIVPGSIDTAYTASKIFPYMLAGKQLLAVFHKASSVVDILEQTGFGTVLKFDHEQNSPDAYVNDCLDQLQKVISRRHQQVTINTHAFEAYSAESMTQRQVDFFDKIVSAQ